MIEGQYTEDEYLMLSGIQHFSFCKRQWAIIHIEQQWEENVRTVDGRIMHKNAHDGLAFEKRKDVLITRGMYVSSSSLGISGECDIVEFRRSEDGVHIKGQEGTYQVIPVEYKKGRPKAGEEDLLQLAAQAICLEKMLCCTISEGYLYYGETRHRQKVLIDDALKKAVRDKTEEMHKYYQRGYTPVVKRTKSCNACSLKDICLPMIGKKKASLYIDQALSEVFQDEENS